MLVSRDLFDPVAITPAVVDGPAMRRALRDFRWEGRATTLDDTVAVLDDGQSLRVETFINEFWTSRQRAAHSLHEISYRACFKPQVPRFFIERLTQAGDAVYDPFMGRGTSLLEAALLDRKPVGTDINPLSEVLLRPRLQPPTPQQVAGRLSEIDLTQAEEVPVDLEAFFHSDTRTQISALRRYLLDREQIGTVDEVDRWIRMVAVNRLTGHSPGFFSVYTLPPNQALSAASQRKINDRRQQVPPARDIVPIILRKTRSLLRDCDQFSRARLARHAPALFVSRASETREIPDESIDLVVTSPPFLNVVDYATDNWLRCWFCSIDAVSVPLTVVAGLASWKAAMREVFVELARILKPGGWVAFEVGEVRGGAVRLEEATIPCGIAAGLDVELVLINAQHFTKTANCWGVSNNQKGTNTNRVVLFRRP